MARDKEMVAAVQRTFYEDEILLFLLGLSLALEYHYSVCAVQPDSAGEDVSAELTQDGQNPPVGRPC
jgi:hypothetical protein